MLEKIKKRIFGGVGGGRIAQRYIVLNGFDGILTVLGITVGAFSTQVDAPIVMISSGVGTAVGLLVSGISGAYVTEKAQRLRQYKELESAMLKDLDGSIHEEKVQTESFTISIFNGLSPFLCALFSLIPYFLASWGLIDMVNTAYYASMGLSGLLLATLGAFLGRIAKESMVKFALKMLLVGAVTAVIMYALGLGSV